MLIGKNGSGKTTLLNLIKNYALCENSFKSIAPREGDLLSIFHVFNNSVVGTPKTIVKNGVSVYGDWSKAVFSMRRTEYMSSDDMLSNISNFSQRHTSARLSAGQNITYILQLLFKQMFEKGTDLAFPIKQLKELQKNVNDVWASKIKDLLKYYKDHTVNCESQFTVLMDEPDQGLDVDNLNGIYDIFSNQRKDTQLIGVLHNVALIYKLSKVKHVNFIELTPNYLEAIVKFMEKT